MHPVIDTLMQEHRVIESALASLAATADAAREGTAPDRATLQHFVEFFSGFADRCHHGKEEDLLFAALDANGMPADRGPVSVMLSEHDEGRRHVRAIARIGQGAGPLTDAERDEFADHAHAFASLLGNHIAKEDNVLYPMSLRLLPEGTLDDMAAAFATFVNETVGAGEHERLRSLADTLPGATSAASKASV